MSRRGGGRRGHRPPARAGYDRVDRLNELLREIVADELVRLGDERLEWVTITDVRTDRELQQAIVYYTAVDEREDDPEILEALAGHRVGLQAAIGRQVRLRRVPHLRFEPDRVVRSAERIEDILRSLELGEPDAVAEPADPGDVDRDG